MERLYLKLINAQYVNLDRNTFVLIHNKIIIITKQILSKSQLQIVAIKGGHELRKGDGLVYQAHLAINRDGP